MDETDYFDAEENKQVKGKLPPPKRKEGVLNKTIDTIIEETAMKKILHCDTHYTIRNHISKDSEITAILRFENKEQYQMFKKRFLDIVVKEQWTDKMIGLANIDKITWLDVYIWMGLGFLLNGFNCGHLLTLIKRPVNHDDIIKSVIVVKYMYGWQTSKLNKTFTADEVYELEHEFWEMYRIQGMFAIIDIFIIDGKRGGTSIAGLVVMTAKSKLRWGEEIPFVLGETDEQIFNRSLFKEELKKIAAMKLAVKCRVHTTAHGIRMHIYGDTKMDTINILNKELVETILNPLEKTQINFECFNSEARNDLNIARNRIRRMIELRPIANLQSCLHLKRFFDYNEFSKEFYKESFEALCLRYNNFNFLPPSFARQHKDTNRATPMIADPDIVTNELFECLYVQDKDIELRKFTKVYMIKTDTIQSTEKVDKNVFKRAIPTAPLLGVITMETKNELKAKFAEAADRIRQRCAAEGVPCII